MNIIRKVAVVCLVVGTILLSGPVFGFSTFAADRGVLVDAADDSSALLGVNETYDGGQIDSQRSSVRDTAEVFELTNNAEQTFTDVNVEVTSVAGDSDHVLEVATQPDLLDVDSSEPVELGCSGTEDSNGVANVTLTMVVSSGDITISNVKRTVTNFDYNCQDEGESPSADGLAYVDGSAQTSNPGSSSDLEFTIENTGDQARTLESFSIARTVNEPKWLNNDQNAEVTVEPNSGDRGTFNNKYQIKEGKKNVQTFDTAPRVEPGSEATITMETFRQQNSNGNRYVFNGIDEDGNDLVITVTTADGREAVFEFGV